MNANRDYYAVLGVLPTAEDVVINGAYRALAQRYHPDRFDGDEGEATARMAAINEAHRILSDPALRSQYDKSRDPFAQRGGDAASGGGGPAFDANLAFEVEQFRPFATKLHEFGYDEAAICEVLRGRGVRQTVAERLARMVLGSAGQLG